LITLTEGNLPQIEEAIKKLEDSFQEDEKMEKEYQKAFHEEERKYYSLPWMIRLFKSKPRYGRFGRTDRHGWNFPELYHSHTMMHMEEMLRSLKTMKKVILEQGSIQVTEKEYRYLGGKSWLALNK
jgi:hypothetical protein